MLDVLTEADGEPVVVENVDGKSPFLFICEHASPQLPERFGTLGLSDEALESHIAWDPGALALARLLATRMDAALIHQRFSRLIYDCNRPPDSEAAMPAVSEVFSIPGNAGITQGERTARAQALYVPFRDTLAGFIAARRAAGRRPALATIHSFTPVYHGAMRSVEIGILHDTDKRLADRMLVNGASDGRYVVRRNEPYGPSDGVTHTLIEHGIKNALLNVMIEVRNDLIRDEAGQRVMASFIADLLTKSLEDLLRGS